MINYYLITKPGIILGNLITVSAGFFLASKGYFYTELFLATLAGLTLIIASACVFNNYIDRTIDQKMERTKRRPIAAGLVSGRNAITFASILGIAGALILFFFTNLLTTVIAAVGFFVYVVLYSMWKRHTIYSTAIGSIAGAVPPVVGYCAVSNRLDAGAVIFFFMMVLWQMPHFYAIALMHLRDYKAAEIPLLPIEKGVLRTKIHMILYIIGFIAVSLMLTVYHYTGPVYFVIAGVLGILWLLLCITGFFSDNDKLWGRRMFQFSLVLITGICAVIPLSH